MDELARRYLTLVLRIGRRSDGMVVAYQGPPELEEAIAAGGPASWLELHDEALRLHEEVAQMEPLGAGEQRRVAWLTTHARAMSAVARVTGGEEIAFPELVEELIEIPAARTPETELETARRLLDAALPPGASLRARLAAHRRASVLDPEAVPAVAEQLLALLRSRSQEDLGLPDGESLTLEPAQAGAESWQVLAIPDGPMRTRLQLNLASAWTLADLAAAISREGYPGRHLLRVRQHVALVEAADRGEAAVAWRPSPGWTVGEGVAAVGRGVLLSDFELAAELRRLAREHGAPADVERELEVARARSRLNGAVANAALMLHHDGLPEGEIEGHLAETGLLESSEVEREMTMLRHPLRRVEPFARVLVPPLVRGWLETTGQTAGLVRLLDEQLTPALLRHEAGST